MSVKSRLIVRNVEGMISKDLAGNAQEVFNEIAKATNAQASEALMVNDAVIILGNKKVTTQSKIQIKNPQVLKDYSLEVEEEFQGYVRKLKEELALTQEETKKLVRTFNTEKKRLENKENHLQTGIELLNIFAKGIKKQSVEDKLLNDLASNQDQLYKVYDSIEVEKSHFSERAKKEIAGMNENLCNRTQDFSNEITGELQNLM